MTDFDRIREFPDKFRTALAFLAQPVAVIDRRRRILYLNPAFEKNFQSQISQSLGKSLEEVFPEVMTDLLQEQLRLLEKDPTSRHFFLRDGEKNYRATLAPIQFKKRHAGSILLLLDVTPEKVIRRFNKELITSLLDDFNYPLNEISLLFSEYPEDTEKLKKHKEKGEKLIRDILEDLNDMVDLCALIFEEEVIKQSTFSPQHILTLALKSLRPRAQEGGVYLEELSQEELPQVVGDQAKLSRIIILLSDYFLKQVPKGELICLSAELKPSLPSHHLLYSVTGTGIVHTALEKDLALKTDSENHSRIRREDKVASRRLFLIQRLVLAMNGSWATAAHEAIGTTVTISIPVEAAKSA